MFALVEVNSSTKKLYDKITCDKNPTNAIISTFEARNQSMGLFFLTHLTKVSEVLTKSNIGLKYKIGIKIFEIHM